MKPGPDPGWRPAAVLAIAFFLLAGCFRLYAQTENPRRFFLRGYAKDLQSAAFTDNADSIGTLNLLHNRLNARWVFSERLNLRVEVRNRVFWGEGLRALPSLGTLLSAGEDEGLLHLSRLWLNRRTLVAHSAVDRLVLQYAPGGGRWDFRLGRQRINWGVHTIWNPNDLFNAYNFLDFDYEERPGTDALRVQHFFKNKNSSLEIAARASNKKDATVAALLFKTNRWQYDFQALGGLYRDDAVLGGGWAGRLGQAGFKGEIAYFHPLRQRAGALSLTAMTDYTFGDSWYLSGALLYQSRQSNRPLQELSLLAGNASAKSLLPFRWTFYAGAAKAFGPLLTASLAAVYSPYRNTLFVLPVLGYGAAPNFDLDLTGQSFFSKNGGKYRAAGHSLYLRVKYSF